MDLSIIIPCYNLENYIEKCLDTILSQKFEEYKCEIIFVCDSCTDETKQVIINRMIKQENFIWKIFTCEYHNPGETRNVGLENCSGDYIWFIDGDDWLIDALAIQKALDFLKQNPSLDFLRFNFQTQGFTYPQLDVMVWRYIFKFKAIENLRFISITPREDDDFIARMKKLNLKGFFITEAWYWYNYPRVGSVMHNTRYKNT